MTSPGSFLPGDVLTADDLNGIGVWVSYTPVVTQGVNVPVTVGYAEYMQINKMVIANIDLTCTTSGTNSSIVTVTLPVATTSLTSRFVAFGNGLVFNAGSTDVILVTPARHSTTEVKLVTDATTLLTEGLGNNPVFQLQSDDVISLTLCYEAV